MSDLIDKFPNGAEKIKHSALFRTCYVGLSQGACIYALVENLIDNVEKIENELFQEKAKKLNEVHIHQNNGETLILTPKEQS